MSASPHRIKNRPLSSVVNQASPYALADLAAVKHDPKLITAALHHEKNKGHNRQLVIKQLRAWLA